MYDFLIVGAGLFGTVCARQMTDNGKKCLVIDRRSHIAGNIYSEEIEGIQVHAYGPHIFHTSDKEVWNYIRQFADFNHFRYEPIANYRGELYNLPFNMNTFHQMWGVNTPGEAETVLNKQRMKIVGEPRNLEEQAIRLIGRDVYEKLIKGYTQKQWGRPCMELPAFIIRRLPVRLRFDNNYFNDPYQGIPTGGYTKMVEKPYTRIIEHKHFEFGKSNPGKTVITREYPEEWKPGEGAEPYYPVNDDKNQALYERYREMADRERHVIFGGRLAEYKYYDMDKVIKRALEVSGREMSL